MAPTDRNFNAPTFMNSDRWQAITPGAGDLPFLYREIYCTATGNATLVDASGTVMALTGIPAFTELPLRPTKITAATATLWGLL